MEEYAEVMRRTLDLAETCIEGLRFISNRLDEGLMEETVYLLEDVLYGFCQITNSIHILEVFLEDHELVDITTKVELAIQDIVFTYECEDINSASSRMNGLLLPAFNSWNEGMISTFHPHILS
ncbi:MAG TPA: hypothetical protein VGI33_03930 [Paenibacillus sp.]